MSDFEIPEEFSDHPLVLGGDERNQWFQKLRREAWNDFRGCSPADIKSLKDWMSDRWRKWEEDAQNLQAARPEAAIGRLVDAWTVRYKLGALTSLLDHIAIHGPHNIPRWAELSESERSFELEGLTPFLPNGTVETARRDREMHQEFWHRREEEQSEAIISDLADRHNLSKKTVEGAVYPKNP
jgi:hypothetical protein